MIGRGVWFNTDASAYILGGDTNKLADGRVVDSDARLEGVSRCTMLPDVLRHPRH